jgi:Ca2+-binding EF-hand superfamily protein
VPQLDFISNEVVRIAKSVVETRDLNEEQFKRLIDPGHLEMMSLTQLQESIQQVRNEHFQMSSEEVEILFKSVTKVQRTLGVNISITKLTEKVFRALDALLIERMRDSVAKSMKPLHELLQRYDANQDGFLECSEVETMFLEC